MNPLLEAARLPRVVPQTLIRPLWVARYGVAPIVVWRSELADKEEFTLAIQFHDKAVGLAKGALAQFPFGESRQVHIPITVGIYPFPGIGAVGTELVKPFRLSFRTEFRKEYIFGTLV